MAGAPCLRIPIHASHEVHSGYSCALPTTPSLQPATKAAQALHTRCTLRCAPLPPHLRCTAWRSRSARLRAPVGYRPTLARSDVVDLTSAYAAEGRPLARGMQQLLVDCESRSPPYLAELHPATLAAWGWRSRHLAALRPRYEPMSQRATLGPAGGLCGAAVRPGQGRRPRGMP